MLEDTSVPEHLGSYVTLRERDLPVLYQVVDANTLEEYHHVLQVTSTEPIIVAVSAAAGNRIYGVQYELQEANFRERAEAGGAGRATAYHSG
jgi:hypothetical protein